MAAAFAAEDNLHSLAAAAASGLGPFLATGSLREAFAAACQASHILVTFAVAEDNLPCIATTCRGVDLEASHQVEADHRRVLTAPVALAAGPCTANLGRDVD